MPICGRVIVEPSSRLRREHVSGGIGVVGAEVSCELGLREREVALGQRLLDRPHPVQLAERRKGEVRNAREQATTDCEHSSSHRWHEILNTVPIDNNACSSLAEREGSRILDMHHAGIFFPFAASNRVR